MSEASGSDAGQVDAEVKLAADAPGGEPRDSAALDETELAAVRESLPSWDVQPFQLSRAVDVPAGTDALRTGLEQVAEEQGRAAEVLVTGTHLVVRVRSAGVGVTGQDVELAAALDAVFSGTQATGSSPGGR